ncbi:MAG TPA: MarR family transcriptional regulator [Bacteroidales bacterium]|mgnify:CR=1 FL=1|nr:MarR family transcriptional regulator [Bacteroidales bacterium]HRW35375.1 MarR family transcriptional regulator [Thermotogota bacterium]
MKKKKEIIKLYMKSVDLMREIESKPRDFGTGDLLYSSTIHTLVQIGKNPGINLTNLAERLDISKSAVSKFILQLLELELITKSKDINNRKEVIFYLSEKGVVAYHGHELFEKDFFGVIEKNVNALQESEKEIFITFLRSLVEELKKVE